VAELVKLMENTFRHVNIALANELAVFAAELKIDMWEALEAAATTPRIHALPIQVRVWAATVCPSTPPTCPGGSNGHWP
jgi:hypothetical protein